MTKRSFITALPLLSSLGAAAAEGSRGALQDHPYLSPENCSHADAYSRWANVDDELRKAFGSSEQGQTRFFEVYAQNLRKWTKEKHPQSEASRPHLETAFTKAAEFINFSVWGVRIHFMPRFPATLEWIIWRGWQGHGKAFEVGEANTRYEIDDLRTLFVILFNSNAEVWKKLAEERARMDESLSALQQAETLLPEAGRKYFRTQLAKQIAEAFLNS
jgi:hypothetical protein